MTDARRRTTARAGALLYPRHDETFPQLTAEEIERLRRFGSERRYRDGERLFARRRARAGHVRRAERARWRSASATASAGASRWSSRGRGSSSPRSGQLSGRPALVDGHAEGDGRDAS